MPSGRNTRPRINEWSTYQGATPTRESVPSKTHNAARLARPVGVVAGAVIPPPVRQPRPTAKRDAPRQAIPVVGIGRQLGQCAQAKYMHRKNSARTTAVSVVSLDGLEARTACFDGLEARATGFDGLDGPRRIVPRFSEL